MEKTRFAGPDGVYHHSSIFFYQPMEVNRG